MLSSRRHPLMRRGHPPAFWLMYVFSGLYIFHNALIGFINSSYLEQFVSASSVGVYYAVGSLLTIAALLYTPRLLSRVSKYHFASAVIILDITLLLLLGLKLWEPALLIGFMFLLVTTSLIGLLLSLFSESLMGSDESHTGSRRALMLMSMSAVYVVATLTLAVVVGEEVGRLNLMYFIAIGPLLCLLFLVRVYLKDFDAPDPPPVRLKAVVHTYVDNPDFRGALLAQLLLRLFFAAQAIYVPLYLASKIGFAWDTIGLLLSISFVAYLLTEYPIGWLSDKRWGEKEMMAAGFLILALSMAVMGFVVTELIIVWAAIVFVHGLGGSLVETTLDSYFFKHTDGHDSGLIGFYRVTMPLATAAGALTGSAALLFLAFHHIFIIIGLMLLPGVYIAWRLCDTNDRCFVPHD